jgi:nitrite reductase/ring-hydroxylating ferredoxin subunit
MSGDRLHANVKGRFVSIIRVGRASLACLDSTCYHAGGPLALGDLEEVNGEACIKCPWHSYCISLHDGSKLYESLQMDPETKKLTPAGWKKKTHAQRVHEVRQDDKTGEVFVRLNLEGVCDSDEYSGSVICGERVKAGDKSGNLRGKDGTALLPERSGHVLMKQKGL